MNTSETWYATRNFLGLGINGGEQKFTAGEPVPNVNSWPTFHSLKNIGWIIAGETEDTVQKSNTVQKTKSIKTPKVETKEVKQEASTVENTVTTKKKTKVTAKTKAEPKKAKTKKTAKTTVDASMMTHICEICDQKFASSRALKVHMRYH